MRANLLIQLGRTEEAERVYWILLERNSENFVYYKQIEKCRSSDDSDSSKIAQIYSEAIERLPKASVPKLMELHYLNGDEFENKIKLFLANSLRKCIPSLFKNLSFIYKDMWKRNSIENILLGYVKKIEENGYNKLSLDGSNMIECPTTVLWIYYYLAQHFDHLENYQRAHKFIDEALNHTPTLIELYMMKAKILKHEKEFDKAADLMVQAQELDTADRYLNSKCAKYLLHAGKMHEAEEMCSRFTRENVNASECLNDMQCLWYELHSAFAFYNLKKYGEALKKCHQIERHFTNFYEDQYDFHSYCVRKMNLSSYVRILRFEEGIRGQKYYIRATKLAMKIYLQMVDNPDMFTEKEFEGTENLTQSDIRKMRRKANKEKVIQERSKQNQNGQTKQQKRNADGEFESNDSELLDPRSLLKTEDPIGDALKFVRGVLILPCLDEEFFALAFRIYWYKNKVLAMLRCLTKIHQIDSSFADLKKYFSMFLEKYKSLTMAPNVSDVVENLVLELTKKISI